MTNFGAQKTYTHTALLNNWGEGEGIFFWRPCVQSAGSVFWVRPHLQDSLPCTSPRHHTAEYRSRTALTLTWHVQPRLKEKVFVPILINHNTKLRWYSCICIYRYSSYLPENLFIATLSWQHDVTSKILKCVLFDDDAYYTALGKSLEWFLNAVERDKTELRYNASLNSWSNQWDRTNYIYMMLKLKECMRIQFLER